MAARTPTRERRDSCPFLSALSSVFFEWLLIILLFIDAFWSYLAAKFAQYCKLPTPCMLCSRLDRIKGNVKPGFYRDFICNDHKLEISLLAYCRTHQRLADAHEMCEGCLVSFASEKASNPEKYKALVGKLVGDLDDGLNADGFRNKFHGEDMMKAPLLKRKDLEPRFLSTRHCSCCSELFRSHANRLLLQNKPHIGPDVTEPVVSLSGSHHQDGLAKGREISSRAPTVYQSGDHGFDHLSHFGYSELKITSDSESEVPFSDDDDGSGLVRGTEDVKEEYLSQCQQSSPVTIIPKNLSPVLSDDMVLEKLIHPAPIMPEPSLLVPEKKLYVGDSQSIPGIGHGLEEINWSQVEVRPNRVISSEFVSEQVPTEVSSANLGVPEIGDVARLSATLNEEVTKALNSTDINSNTSQTMNESSPTNLNETCKLATGAKGTLPSSNSAEIFTGRESAKVPEDLKLRLSQLSAAQWLEVPWNGMMTPSPRANGQGDESKLSDASSSTGLQIAAKRFSIDRNESGTESLDGSLVSEVEGESTVDRLKQQIEMDRKSMNILYKELEEERSSSAISANQTMAMINRLQEEKAAMQMEALQYLRMMEEQTEYDQEALEKLNDLLADREKEIQDLEAEVERYRRQFGDESLEGKALESLFDSEEREYNPNSTPHVMRSRVRDKSGQSSILSKDLVKTTLVDFEDEKVYISECLRRLEKKVCLFSNHEVYAVASGFDSQDRLPDENSLSVDNATRNGQYSKEAVGDDYLENIQKGGVIMSEKKDSALSREDSHVKKTSTPSSTQGIQFSIKALKESRLRSISYNDRQFPMLSKRNDAIALGNEVSRLNARLEALEVDRGFLEHSVNSIRNGTDGLQFIQEIACHLRELRKIGITQREHTVASAFLDSYR